MIAIGYWTYELDIRNDMVKFELKKIHAIIMKSFWNLVSQTIRGVFLSSHCIHVWKIKFDIKKIWQNTFYEVFELVDKCQLKHYKMNTVNNFSLAKYSVVIIFLKLKT